MRVGEFTNPINPASDYDRQMGRRLVDYFRELTRKVNDLATGNYAAIDNALTAAPASGTYVVGDFRRNSAPSELGVATAKYVIYGFICVASGTPGTWVECRFLTGN